MIGYELFTGEAPFAGLNLIEQLAKKRKFTAEKIASIPSVSKKVSTLIQALVQPNPKDRPQAVEEVIRGLTAGEGHNSASKSKPIGGLLRALIMLLIAALVMVLLIYFELKKVIAPLSDSSRLIPLPILTPEVLPQALAGGTNAVAADKQETVVVLEATPGPLGPLVTPNLSRTTLRIVEGPIGHWAHTTVTRLTKINLKIRNVGSVDATDVVVRVAIPEGEAILLPGPALLKRNEVGSYEVELDEVVTSREKLRAQISCGNCRK